MDEIKGYLISASGDSEVGIPSASWQLTGSFFFKDKEFEAEFRKALLDVFLEHIGEDVGISSFEEHEALLRKEFEDMGKPFKLR